MAVFVFVSGCVCLRVAALCVAVWLCADGSISLAFRDEDQTVAAVAHVRFETSM